MNIEGIALNLNIDNIDTDQIIPAQYLVTTDENILGKYCLINYKLDLNGKVLITGNNFGCGSSREHAVIALRGAGVKAVIAKSFARIFFRNAINNGFPVIEGNFNIPDGTKVEIDLSGTINADGKIFKFEKYPPFLMEIVSSGGLMNYLRRKSGL